MLRLHVFYCMFPRGQGSHLSLRGGYLSKVSSPCGGILPVSGRARKRRALPCNKYCSPAFALMASATTREEGGGCLGEQVQPSA